MSLIEKAIVILKKLNFETHGMHTKEEKKNKKEKKTKRVIYMLFDNIVIASFIQKEKRYQILQNK